MESGVCQRLRWAAPAQGAKRKTRVPAQPCIFSTTEASRPSTAIRLKVWIRVSGLRVRGAQVEEGNLEDMTGFKSRAKDNARRVFVLARVVMDWFGLR